MSPVSCVSLSLSDTCGLRHYGINDDGSMDDTRALVRYHKLSTAAAENFALVFAPISTRLLSLVKDYRAGLRDLNLHKCHSNLTNPHLADCPHAHGNTDSLS